MRAYVDYQRIEDCFDLQNAADYQALIGEGQTETGGGIQYLVLAPSKNGKNVSGKPYEFGSR